MQKASLNDSQLFFYYFNMYKMARCDYTPKANTCYQVKPSTRQVKAIETNKLDQAAFLFKISNLLICFFSVGLTYPILETLYIVLSCLIK